MHHSCPHHGLALARNRINAIDTWRCERCEGIWLPGAVVAKVVGSAPRWPARADTRATELFCPDDGTHLRSFDADGIELDLCPHCHGLWLDRGELERIVRRARREAAADEVRDMVEELVDHAAETVDEVLSSPRRVSVRSKDIDGDAPMPSKSLPSSASHAAPAQSGASSLQPDPAKLPAFDVELDPRAATSLSDSAASAYVDVADVPDAGIFDGATDLAAEALGAVFEFIGSVFSSF